MVKQSTIYGMWGSIALLVVVLIYCFIWARKKEFMVSAVLWGVVSFLVYTTVGTLLNILVGSVFFESIEAFSAYLNSGNSIGVVLYTTLVATIALVASAVMVTSIQRKRGKVNAYTGEITGSSIALFSWINPANSLLLSLINSLMYAHAINSGESLYDSVSAESREAFDAFIQSLINSDAQTYILVALTGVALLVLYRAVFKWMHLIMESNQGVRVKVLTVGAVFFGAYLLLQVFANGSLNSFVSIFGMIAVAACITWLVEKTKFLKAQ